MSPGSGRPPWRLLVVGAASFTLTLVLILAVVGAVIAVRGSSGEGDQTPSAATTSVSASPSSSQAAQYCWRNPRTSERTSEDPSGGIRAGGLEAKVPSGWTSSSNAAVLPFLGDASVRTLPLEGDWVSLVVMAKVTWQPGTAYPGAETASRRYVDCSLSDTRQWDRSVPQRHVQSTRTEAVTIDGMHGYRTTAVLAFDRTTLRTARSTVLTAIVLDTPQGPAVYYSDISQVPAHVSSAARFQSSLRAAG